LPHLKVQFEVENFFSETDTDTYTDADTDTYTYCDTYTDTEADTEIEIKTAFGICIFC
jgi:hypothetical protein